MKGKTMFKKFFYLCSVIFVLILFPAISLAASDTVLYFSDITSGPKTGLGDGLGSGAIVTVWGKNLGSSQGASKIYTGGVESARVYYWGNADGSAMAGPAKLYESHGMQTISFSIASTATDGFGNIYVVVNGVQSNTLPFTVRTGAIKHVKTTGTDQTGCGGWGSPCRTLNYIADSRATTGEIYYAGDGVQESSGFAIRYIKGTADNPISVIAYPGARVVAQGSFGIGNYNHDSAYWNFSKLIVKSQSDGIGTFKGMRAVGNEITNYPAGCANGQGGAITGDNYNNANDPSKDVVGGGIKALGNYIHDFGCDTTDKLHHVFYISNRGGYSVESYELGWNYLRDNKVHHGLFVYDEGRCGDFSGTMRIHDNIVMNQVGAAVGVAARGTDPCFTMPIEIYNNILINNGLEISTCSGHTTAVAFTLAQNRSNIKFYNNTIYGYGDATDGSGNYLDTEGFGGTLEYMNNIVVDTKNFSYQSAASLAAAIHSNNIWYNDGDGNPASPPSWDTNPITSDPLFVNPSAGDFTLQSSSPAIDAGSSSVASVVTKDFNGNTRPMGTGYDIGAYEYAGPVVPMLQFSSATYSVSESTATATISVTRTGSSTGAVSVNYATSNGTATSGSDYTSASGTLNWADGDVASKTFTVSIINDTLVEGDETINLALSSPTNGAILGSQSTATLTILDDDGPSTLRFENTSYSVSEGAGTATIRVLRTGSSAGAVSVNYATSNGTATAGSDYTSTSGTLNWASGDTAAKSFTITIINDTVVESSETVNITLSNQTTGALLGGTNPVALTITDNDSAGGGSSGGNTLNAAGGDSVTGGGCGFVKDDNGNGPRANGEGLTLMMMLILTLAGIAIARRFSNRFSYNL